MPSWGIKLGITVSRSSRRWRGSTLGRQKIKSWSWRRWNLRGVLLSWTEGSRKSRGSWRPRGVIVEIWGRQLPSRSSYWGSKRNSCTKRVKKCPFWPQQSRKPWWTTKTQHKCCRSWPRISTNRPTKTQNWLIKTIFRPRRSKIWISKYTNCVQN